MIEYVCFHHQPFPARLRLVRLEKSPFIPLFKRQAHFKVLHNIKMEDTEVRVKSTYDENINKISMLINLNLRFTMRKVSYIENFALNVFEINL